MSHHKAKVMQKNIKPFTDTQIEKLKNNYSEIAKEYGVDPSYVRRIANGTRNANTDKAKKILAALTTLANAFNSICA